MEGSYMPSYHRAKIIKEVRNTHFHFGNDPKEYKTTNFTDFKGKATSVSISKPTSNISHIQLSNDIKDRFTTESNSKFRSTSEEPRLSPFKPSPAITLQNVQGNYVTTSSNAFKKLEKSDQLPGLSRKTHNFMLKKMRKHNFDFGNRKSLDMKMEEKEIRNESPNIVVPSAKEIKKKYIKEIESLSNGGPYVSTSFHDYKSFKPESPAKPVKINEISSIKYPEISNEYFTTTQQKHNQKVISDYSLSPKRLSDLKSSHLNLGASPTNYSISSYQQSPAQSKLCIVKKSPTTSITPQLDQPDYKSVYAYNFPNHPNRAHSVSNSVDIIQKSQNLSSVNLGVAKHSYLTESRAVHKSINESPARLSPECERLLKTDHFALGTDNKTYTTVSGDYGKNKTKIITAPTQSSRIMNQTNFKFGNHSSPMKSEKQKEYSWKAAEAQKQVEKGAVNKGHFLVGDDKSPWKSNYNSNYGWIQPVPDTNYKPGIMKKSF